MIAELPALTPLAEPPQAAAPAGAAGRAIGGAASGSANGGASGSAAFAGALADAIGAESPAPAAATTPTGAADPERLADGPTADRLAQLGAVPAPAAELAPDLAADLANMAQGADGTVPADPAALSVPAASVATDGQSQADIDPASGIPQATGTDPAPEADLATDDTAPDPAQDTDDAAAAPADGATLPLAAVATFAPALPAAPGQPVAAQPVATDPAGQASADDTAAPQTSAIAARADGLSPRPMTLAAQHGQKAGARDAADPSAADLAPADPAGADVATAQAKAPDTPQAASLPAPATAPQVQTAAAPVQSAPVPLPVDTMQAGWEARLADGLALRLADSGQEIELMLTPETLGPVHITIGMEEGSAQVRIVTDNPQAAQLFQQSENRLAEALSRMGLSLAQHDASARNSRDPKGRGGRGGDALSGTEASGPSRRDAAPPVFHARRAGSLLNIVA